MNVLITTSVGTKVTKKGAFSYTDGHLQLTKRLLAAIDPKRLKRLIFVGGTSLRLESLS
ncbi:hypothetical protein WMW72_22815 [Paenibacillus filicis]|uniref:Uncharacterized protein n=1 Tax=Paenibacillus filicis TaxID=669464 RepID=A0ABU9DRN7_9BACL